jgi:hypothetical protein
MKLLKTLTLGLLAAAAVGTASAQTTIHLVGSTAYRAPDTAAIIDFLATTTNLTSGSAVGISGVHAGIAGSSQTNNQAILGAGAAIIANGTLTSGSTPGTASIIIETYWTGSLSGVVDVVASNTTGAYLDPSGISSTGITAFNGSTVTNSPYGSTGLLGTVTATAAAPDAAFSDSYQGTISKELATGTMTAPVGSYSSISTLATACASGAIVDSGSSGNAGNAGGTFGFVGIVPFEVCIGAIADTTVTSAVSNISQQALNGLIGTGYVPQSYLTGGSGTKDTGNYFYWTGRNEDSGTRILYLQEPQFGAANSPVQLQITGNPVTSAQKYPVTALNTEPNIVWNTAGHSGYASGGNVQTALDQTENSSAITFGANGGKASENSLASYFISSLGLTDALATISGGGKALSYSGVPFSVAAVENGQYTLWSYEHCYRLSGLTGTKLTTINGIADKVYNADADVKASDGTHDAGAGQAAGILDNASSPVLVYRSVVEGGNISNY